jgi:hypothetical protein
MERLFAWLQNYRRLITRHERHTEDFLGFVRLGCISILLGHFSDGVWSDLGYSERIARAAL